MDEMNPESRVQILDETISISYNINPIYPTPPLGQDMKQGQFLSEV